MNVKEIKEMIDLMNENNLTELEIEKNGTKIKLRRQTTAHAEGESLIQGPVIVERQTVTKEKESGQKSVVSSKHIQIKSPMIGTFYRAPSPDSPPFVDTGDELEVGQVVCIIEAMKLMNEIKSDIKGKVIEILAENGQAVEFGQPLFLLEPL